MTLDKTLPDYMLVFGFQIGEGSQLDTPRKLDKSYLYELLLYLRSFIKDLREGSNYLSKS